MKRSKRVRKWGIITGFVLLSIMLSCGSIASRYWLTFYRPNVHHLEAPLYINVPSNATFNTLMDVLEAQQCLRSRNTFIRAANKEHLPERLKGGRYQIRSGMNNKTLVRMVALGLQSPVNLTISGNIRSVEKLATVLTRNLEADSLSMLMTLTNEELLHQIGFDSTSLFSLVLPNTYQVYWNTSPEKIVERLYKEYQRFWNEERREQAASIGLSLLQVSTLASIVQEETNYKPEMPTVAGVYMNRLKIGMPLQADPTLKFALKDFGIRRLLNKDKNVDSPYNTYKYKGLPPGPICVPSLATLEAVLYYESHHYLYFCASPESNGTHLFATNLSEHNRNARAYQQVLNQRGVMR